MKRIVVTLGLDTFYFSSYDGRHYWCVLEGKSNEFWHKNNMVVPTAMFTGLHLAALEQGFTAEDFANARTTATHSTKASTERKTRVSSGGKLRASNFARKYPNAIKLSGLV